MQSKPPTIRQRWANARLSKGTVVWISLGVMIVTIVLGFTWGGWVTTSTAERLAKTAAQDAVVARLTPLCLMQFDQDPDRDEKLDALQLLSSASRQSTYVRDQGWATMPGETTADSRVATQCARQLAQFDG